MMTATDLDIARGWTAQTSSDPERWTEDNPAWGQCAVTALITQELLGGDLVRCMAKRGKESISHYANRIEDGTILDLTREQFGDGWEFTEWEDRTRHYVMSYWSTVFRYMMLRWELGMMTWADR